ncbi:hypothetical protein MTR_5g089530 [Medicago truncatula]|uniref:Uncharacterized protein n=1 Tax=Medicago truncatula TaxID=3880 RepID=G7K340_MEDTR|nr:hypothetical protein MTR_5g089530 [Medicago truncatula]
MVRKWRALRQSSNLGGEGRVLEKRKEQVEEIEDIGMRGLWSEPSKGKGMDKGKVKLVVDEGATKLGSNSLEMI